jgi:hydroxymethylpyrimidine pyrophosphatase-like HAD family hydrolase
VASRVAEEFESQARSVELIISDVDGTLLNEQQQLTPGVQAAAVAAAAAGVPLIVATGKAMGPWRDVVLPHIGSRMPQVSLLWGC